MKWLLAAEAVWILASLNLGCATDELRQACPKTCHPYEAVAGIGACDWGEPACDADGKVTACIGYGTPDTEVCDGLDNDCDGHIDGPLTWPTDPCMLLGECSYTYPVCTGAGGWVCPYRSSVELPAETSCDGLDNDCDGRTDEDLFPGQYCYEGPIGTETTAPCHPGVLGCVRGLVHCVNQGLPRAEVCDGADNDCDGIVDDGYTSAQDIVIGFDRSGSMSDERTAVVGGLDALMADTPAVHQWGLVTIGQPLAPFWGVEVPMGPAEPVRDRLRTMPLDGGVEPSLDMITAVCAGAVVQWRAGAPRVLLVIGDEVAQGGNTELYAAEVCALGAVEVHVWAPYHHHDGYDGITAATGGALHVLTPTTNMAQDLADIVATNCGAESP